MEVQKIDCTPEILFSFVRDMIYDPNNASIDLDDLNAGYRELGEGLVALSDMLNEQRHFAEALARGDLRVPLPSRDNELAAPLKSLHASLRHMTWQSQQVAMGDYQQRIDFMGEFSNAFNAMIRQLDARQKALEHEIEAGRKKTQALENSNNLFVAITAQLPQIIFVIYPNTHEVMFQNEAAGRALGQNPFLLDDLLHLLRRTPGGMLNWQNTEISSTDGNVTRYYSIHHYPIHWSDKEAIAFIADDISEDREHLQKLEERANIDELTRLYTRHYGMEKLKRWLSEGKTFCICFADLDYLKYVNDTFGHNMGDAYIIAAATILRDLTPDTVACRVGGDEFMLLVPSLDEEQVTARMNELQEKLALAPKEIAADEAILGRLKFRISFGAVQAPTDGSVTASELLAIADEKMYECKRRNKSARQS